MSGIVSWYVWSQDKAEKRPCTVLELTQFDNAFALVISGGLFHTPTLSEGLDPNKFNHFQFYLVLLSYARSTVSEAGDRILDTEQLPFLSTVWDPVTGVCARAADLGFPTLLEEEPVGASYNFGFSYYVDVVGSKGSNSGTMFFTDDGLMGVAKGNIEVGDQLCALYGDTIPFILRRDDTGKHWRVVGTAFVDPRFNDEAYWETGKDDWFSLF